MTFYDTYFKELGYFDNPKGQTMTVFLMTARPMSLVIPGGSRRFGEIENGKFRTRVEGIDPMFRSAANRLADALTHREMHEEKGVDLELRALRNLAPVVSDRYGEMADKIYVVAFREEDARGVLEIMGYRERDCRL